MRLNHKLLPLSDYHKAKDLFWDPRAIDLTRDRTDWASLAERERDLILRGASVFLVGEEAVAHDLIPLLLAIRRAGGHTEEEMFLATQLFEEAKHFEWFDRWLTHVIDAPVDATKYFGAAYRKIFYDELPRALNRLMTDHSTAAMVEAVTLYHLTIEGALAETGYYGFAQALKENDLLPGLLRGLELVQRDEARHIAFGTYLLKRLVQPEPNLFEMIQARLNELLPQVLALISEVFEPYGDEIPFGLNLAEMMAYAGEQLTSRLNAVARALPQPA
ncbi:MAG: R2-like ligand-binding oxidase [Chloroflexi bacterium]|nr:R2-like ligand-binding oxidase [Chloroflexota bacterium]